MLWKCWIATQAIMFHIKELDQWKRWWWCWCAPIDLFVTRRFIGFLCEKTIPFRFAYEARSRYILETNIVRIPLPIQENMKNIYISLFHLSGNDTNLWKSRKLLKSSFEFYDKLQNFMTFYNNLTLFTNFLIFYNFMLSTSSVRCDKYKNASIPLMVYYYCTE